MLQYGFSSINLKLIKLITITNCHEVLKNIVNKPCSNSVPALLYFLQVDVGIQYNIQRQ